jgi:hypothetical protein
MAIAAIGLGLQALGMGMDVAQMIGAKKAQREAQIRMDKSIEEAKRLVQINRAEQLQVPLEKYERQLAEQARTAKTALGALGEADPRLLAAGVGRIGETVRRGTEAITEDMSQELAGRQEKIIANQQAIDEALANISLAEASGDAQAVADARRQYSQALAGITSAAQSGFKTFMEGQGLYKDTSKRDARKARKELDELKKQDGPLDESLFMKDPMDASADGTFGTELG